MHIPNSSLIHFLQEDLHIPAETIRAIAQLSQRPDRIVVALWQQKLITLSQLDQLFRWLETYDGKAVY